MRQKKIKILVGVLLALVLFASSVALLMYSKQNELNKYVENHIEVYIAKGTLVRGQMIGIDDIKMSRLPKSYIDFTPLTKEEILGKYTKNSMMSNEPFRPSKLSLMKPKKTKAQDTKVKTVYVEKEKEEVKQLTSDTISISLSVFKNLDTSLQKGDFIDIVSVVPKSVKGKEMTFKTKYIALHVPIHSFVANSRQVDKLLSESYNEDSKRVSISLANEVVFDMPPNNVKNFLTMYYQTQLLNNQRALSDRKKARGHLWMVKCSSEEDPKLQKEKERLLVDAKRKAIKRARKIQRVSISYEK